MNLGTKQTNYAAKCPACEAPHHYVGVTFPMANDRGGWEVECRECGKPFSITLSNPVESFARDFRILERFEDDHGGYRGSAPPAVDVLQHVLDLNQSKLRFAYDDNPIYRCSKGGADLERAALAALEQHLPAIGYEFYGIRNYILASKAPDIDHAVVTVPVPCQCGSPHKAIFYFPLRLNESPIPRPREMLLADVDGCSLDDELTGIFSKAYLMQALEKLIARWRLKYDQVLIASPFIGHQYLSKAEKLGVWEWLLGMLDPGRTLFITRSPSYKQYKAALLDSGLDHGMLASFGLESRLVGAGTKKHDFHAKVYIGLGDRCEVLSGSANLVPGKSMENASFAVLERKRVDARYLKPLGAKLPQAPKRAEYHLAIEHDGTAWGASIKKGASPI